MDEPTHSALIVPVPEAEEVVGPFRMELDAAAAWGVPAHVTVLYPFLAPSQIDDGVLAALAELVAGVPRFRVRMARVDWFGDAVVWLAPEPDEPFRVLTAAVWRRFPDSPPYGGAHEDTVPHLTIGHGAARPVLERAGAAVGARLPIAVVVESVRLIAGTPGRPPWRTIAQFPLGA